jgi:hypothetical protein
MNEKIQQKISIWTFISLYVCVGFVSCYHAISFFSISNPVWLGIILALAFEVGQAVVLFSILTNPGKESKKPLPWILMGILTIVQILGNVFSSYKFAMIHNTDQIDYFTKSVLFFVQSPNPDYNYVMISYITGAILPIVALFMTSMVANKLREWHKEEVPDKPESQPEPDEDVVVA